MAKYIELEVALREIERRERLMVGDKTISVDALKRFLLNRPAADVTPVVRCKDCKHCDPENYHCDHAMSTAAPLRRKPDDFCSYGERKERC